MSQEKNMSDDQDVITGIKAPVYLKYNFTAGAAPARCSKPSTATSAKRWTPSTPARPWLFTTP